MAAEIPTVISMFKAGEATLLESLGLLNLTGVAIMGVIAALYALYKAYDKANITAEEQLEIFNDLNTKYESTKSELDSLVDSLETVRDRIKELDELSKSGSITPDQTKELKQLEAEEKALERQIQIKERLAEVERKAAEKAAIETLSKREHTVEGETVRRGSEVISSAVNLDDAEAINYYIAKLEEAQIRKEQLEDELANADLTDTQISQHNSAIKELEDQMISYEESIGAIITAVQPLLDSITATSGAAAENKEAIKTAIDAYLEFIGTSEDTADSVVGSTDQIVDSASRITGAIESFSATTQRWEKLREALESLGEVSSQALPADLFAEILELCPEAAGKVTDVASAYKVLSDALIDAENDAEETYGTMQWATEEWVEKTLNSSEALTKALVKYYGTDITNWKKTAEAKWEVDSALVNNLSSLWAKYIGMTADELERLNNMYTDLEIEGRLTPGSSDYKMAQELRAYLEMQKELEIAFENFSAPSTSGGSKSKTDQNKKAFEAAYNAKKYELEMEKITLEEFYAWLDGEHGYRDYFEEQGETLEDFRKYSKEVFDGLRDVHQQYLDVLDHEISVIERTDDSENELIAKYAQKRAEVHELIKELRKYLELQNMTEAEIISNEQYRAYMDMLYSIEDEVASIQEDAYEKQAGYVNDLIDLTEELIRQETEDHIDALKEEKDMYSELIQQRKDLINLSRDQDTYERDRQNKLKEIQKVQERIAALDLDDSREAALEKQTLLEKLSELQIELDDMQTEHYIESAEKALDDKEKAVHEEYDREIKALEDFLDNNAAVNQAAMAELDQMNKDLFDRLESYAAHYTDTTRDELLKMWKEVTAAAEKYGSVTNASKVYEDSDVDNKVKDIIRKMRENGQEYARSTDENRKQVLADDSLKLGAELQKVLGVTVERVNGTWYIGDGPNRKKLFDVYHSGTPSVGGHATIKQNETFALLEKGESVLTKKQTNVLWEALKTFDLTKKLSSSISKFIPGATNTSEKKEINIEVVMQPTIYGDATDVTMGVIRKEARNVADIVASKLR